MEGQSSLSNEQQQSATKLAYYELLTGDLRREDFQLMRWEIAGLLTVNTGGALAAFNSESLSPIFQLIAGLLFTAGALSTFAFAHFARTYLQVQMRTAMYNAVYWRDTVALNARRFNKERHLKTYEKLAHKKHKPLIKFKLSSAIFFIVGITSLALQPTISKLNSDNRNSREIEQNTKEESRHLKLEKKAAVHQCCDNIFPEQINHSKHTHPIVASSALKPENALPQ